MYKPEAPGGWRLLDEYHSPAETARYVKELGDGWHAVVDVSNPMMSPAGYRIDRSVERGLFENTGGHDRPYHDTEVRSQETVATGLSEGAAFERAEKIMMSDGAVGASSGLFDDLF
jgi:hypothetical protein